MHYERRITEALSKDEAYSLNSRARVDNYQLHDSEIFNEDTRQSNQNTSTMGKEFDPKDLNFAP